MAAVRRLERALARLETPHRVVLLHYAPIRATVAGLVVLAVWLLAAPPAAHAGSLLVVIALMVAAPAHAQHDHHHHGGAAPTVDAPAPRPFEVGLTATAGRFDQTLYVGDYAGLAIGLGWRHGRVGVRAALPAYHLRKNGAAVDGVGDAMVGVDVVALVLAGSLAG